MVPVMFAFEAIVIELPFVEISAMFSFEPMVIMLVVSAVVVMSMPFRIPVIGISRIG